MPSAPSHPLTGEAPQGGVASTEEHAPRRAVSEPSAPGRVRRALGWLLIGVIVVLLWPATWGGLFGITVVDGHSMEPVYNSDDIVLTLRHASYEMGDVISYKVPAGQDGAGGRVIHRIIDRDGSGAEPIYTTKGDNNPSVDPWNFTTADVVGEATLHVPRIGAVFSGSNGLLLGAVAGFAVLVVLWPSSSGSRTDEPGRVPVDTTE